MDTWMKDFLGFMDTYENEICPDLDAFNHDLQRMQKGLEVVRSQSPEEKEKFAKIITQRLDHFHEVLQISLLSVLAYLMDGGGYAEKIIRLARTSKYLSEENRYFLYLQIMYYDFRHKDFLSAEGHREHRMLYRDIYDSYRVKMHVSREVVPIAQRDAKTVLFFIGQFLSEEHGPTKTVLDRCEIMAKKMGCRAILINTNEMHGAAGYFPYCNFWCGNLIPEYQSYDAIGYNGRQYAYHQCSDNMPNIPEMQDLIQVVRALNPYCIFMVGGGSICADLCSNYYPLIDISTVPSSIATTEGQFVLTGKRITQEDRQYAEQLGKGAQYLQYCLFTSSLLPQEGTQTRGALQIPEKAFAAIVVGARLDYEVDDEFIRQVLIPLTEHGIFIVFMGGFMTYAQKVKQYPVLEDTTVYAGFRKDVLAVNETCDIYLNPRRNGGGTSVVEAMSKGLPPVSLAFGDVALGAGEEFCVETYPDMVARVLRMQTDAAYYQEMRARAKARAAVMLDGSTAFWEAFQRIEQLPEFQG